MSASLLVRSAGLDWRFELDSIEVRDELAAWLGPWVRLPARGGGGEDLGVVRMVEADGLPAGGAGVRRCPEGFTVGARDYDILVAGPEGPGRAEVRYRNGSATAAARLALRIVLIRSVFARGGLALHAASAGTGDGVLLFVGPVGAGKSTAARAFPERARLDDDLALVSRDEKSRRWVRLSHFEGRPGPAGAEELPLRAVLLPRAGEAFRLEPLRGREALAGCLQLPFFACPPDGPGAAEELRSIMARVEELCTDLPVARFAWSVGEDLPALLNGAL